eukprot:7129183-Prorocentrum_lima.AAC.1
MTSSLVGSEMCIRDSPYRLHSSLAVSIVNAGLRSSLRRRRPHRRPHRPVSYTHLTLPTICSV